MGKKSIAIDFGTTKTLVSYWDEEKDAPQLVKLGQFVDQIPSSIFIAEDGSVRIGEEADRCMFQDYTRYCRVFKMKIGEDSPCLWKVNVNGGMRNFTAKDLTEAYLKEIRRLCESKVFHGDTIENAIITVPVAFDEVRRQSLMEAAKSAGLEVTLLDEPIAAGRAYLEMSHGVSYKSVLVVDWGGGTLDVSLVKNEDGVMACGKRQTFGSCDTGGEVLDRCMFDLIVARCGIKLSPRERMEESVFQQEEMRKYKELLAVSAGSTCVRFIPKTKDQNRRTYDCLLTRNDFETSISKELEIVKRIVNQACDELKDDDDPFDMVLLIGGSSQIPAFAECVSEATGKIAKPWEHSRQAVALGAAYYIQPSDGKTTGQDISEEVHPKLTVNPTPDPVRWF